MTAPLGPANRTTFFEEQARNRRKTVRFAVFAMVTVALTGIPLSILVTPALYLVALTIAHLIQLATPLPRELWAVVDQAGKILPTAIQQLVRAVETRSLAPLDWGMLATVGTGLVVPGMVLMVLLWLWVRLIFSRAGTGGIMLRIGARLPRETDLEEKQLVNLIEEMAIAGGVKRPRVMLLDTDAVNAAALGTEIDDATLVVTRGLLNQLNRHETQGIIAHLIGSVGNGDLKILNLVFSVFQTFGLLGVLLTSFSSRGARRKLWRTMMSLFRRGDRGEIERVADLLAANQSDVEDNPKGGCLGFLVMPFVFAGLTVQALVSIGAWLFFGPPLTAMWRARRLLADATAVQLNRNPDGIAHALQRLTEAQVEFPNGQGSRILFVHWSSYVGGSSDLSQSGRFHPDLWRRISRLQQSGAKLMARHSEDDGPAPKRALWIKPFLRLLQAIVSVVMVAGIAVTVAVGGLMAAMSLGILGAALYAIHAFFANLPAITHFVTTDLPKIGRALLGMVEELIKLARR